MEMEHDIEYRGIAPVKCYCIGKMFNTHDMRLKSAKKQLFVKKLDQASKMI